jgi:hypothetical protein
MAAMLARLLLLLALSALPPNGAWRVLHPQTKDPRGSDQQPAIRYGHASARLGDAWVLTHGYFFDHDSASPQWLSDTWSMDVHAPYSFRRVGAGIAREHTRAAYGAGRAPDAPYGRFGTASVAHGGSSVYLSGGQDGGHSQHDQDGYEPGYEYDELWRLDLTSGRWSHVQPRGATPGARFLHAMAAIGDRLFLYGGTSPGQGDVWAFDVGASEWQLLAPELPAGQGGPGRRSGHRMLPVAGQGQAGRSGFLVLAGRTFLEEGKFDLADDAWFFDVGSRRWQLLAPSGGGPPARMYHAADWLALQHADHSARVGVLMGGTTRIPSVLCAADAWAFALDCNLTRISWSRSAHVEAPLWPAGLAPPRMHALPAWPCPYEHARPALDAAGMAPAARSQLAASGCC